ncbi:MAG: STAS domain-containing protein [Nocardioidaceae bacterium]
MNASRLELQAEPVESRAGQAILVTATGEIDSTNVADFEAQVRRAVGSSEAIIDLTGVAYFDSTGFAALDRMLAPGSPKLAVVIAEGSMIARAAQLVSLRYYGSVDAARASSPSQPTET